jgi:Zn-dependent peptidase ImmA (M78 family)
VASIHSNRGFKRARIAREELGVGDNGPLPDALDVVEGRGGAAVVVLDLGEGLAGAHLVRPAGPLLFVNGRQGLTRQRFTLAHEFGHHRIGHATMIDRPSNLMDFGHDPLEVEANAFAAEFLIPRAAVEAWHAALGSEAVTLEHLVRLAGDYGVSAQMARYRLQTCGVLTDAARRDKLDREIAANEHVLLAAYLGLTDVQDRLAHAADDLPRIPPDLRDSPFGRLLAGELDVAGLAACTGQGVAAVERMLINLGLDVFVATS